MKKPLTRGAFYLGLFYLPEGILVAGIYLKDL
jgi:hypothetical protein